VDACLSRRFLSLILDSVCAGVLVETAFEFFKMRLMLVQSFRRIAKRAVSTTLVLLSLRRTRAILTTNPFAAPH